MDIRKTVQDAAYVTVGFGVITFQQAQVRRREAAAKLEAQTREARHYVETRARGVYDKAVGVGTELREFVVPVVDEVRHRVEPLVGQLQEQVQTVPDRLVHVAQEGASRINGSANGTPSTN